MSVTGWTESSPAKGKLDPKSGKASLTLVYFCECNDPDKLTAVLDYAYETVPTAVTAPLGLTATLVDIDAQQEGAKNIWWVTATWEVPEWRADDGETPPDSVPWSFDTTGGSAHINASRSVVGQYVASGVTEVAAGGSICDDGQGNVNGADVVVPSCRMEVVNTYTLSAFNPGSLLAAYRKTGKVNSGSLSITVGPGKVFTFSAGEALFAGVRASYDPKSGNVQVYCNFLGSANESSISIDSITGISKNGHDFLDVRHITKKDETTGKMTRSVSEVIVHRVYEYTDLNGLCGI